MVITPRYKYVFNGWDFDELYDLQDDPHELRNFIDEPAYETVRDDLRTLLYAQMERFDDPYAQNRYGATRYLPRPRKATPVAEQLTPSQAMSPDHEKINDERVPR